jgi:hypothetical protein
MILNKFKTLTLEKILSFKLINVQRFYIFNVKKKVFLFGGQGNQ